MSFTKDHDSFSIRKILAWNNAGKLNLNPGFQRASVWVKKDRQMLIDTILRGMPLPNLFLWEHKEGNKVVYDVIDGKQRIESLLEFTKHREPLSLKFDPEGDSDWVWKEVYEWTWKEIKQTETKITSRFLDYEFPVVLVKGSLPDIEQVFIRINSTGKKLTPQEIRHAKWYENSELLLTAEAIAKTKKYEKYFLEMGILSPGQITRMKAIELITELMLSIEKQDVLDRKKSLDSVMGNKSINKNTIAKLGRDVKSILDLIKNIFPDLHTSRFSRSSDFYALFFAVWKMKRDGHSLKDKQIANMAFQVLNQLGLELSEYRQSFKNGKPKKLKSPALEYHNTVLEGTDTARHRRDRVRIIESILRPIFNQKDAKRLFSIEQKQILWHSSKDKCCSNPECGKILTWKDVRMDHIKAHTKGGRTDLRNAQILCSKCNSSKGGN
jgi:5-methylcytosine-specific restriction endonuclease McrA